MDKLQNNVITKIGIIVRDAKKASENLAGIFGIKEATLIPGGECHNPDCKTIYNGKHSEETEWLSACYDMGAVRLEFLQPVKGQSTWKEFLDKQGEGIHHIAWQEKETGKVVELFKGKDIDVVQKGFFKGGECTYFSSEDKLGFVVEVVEK